MMEIIRADLMQLMTCKRGAKGYGYIKEAYGKLCSRRLCDKAVVCTREYEAVRLNSC